MQIAQFLLLLKYFFVNIWCYFFPPNHFKDGEKNSEYVQRNIKTILVIGAGPSGLTTMKNLLDVNPAFKITCLEQENESGGLWKFRETKKKYSGSCYESLKTNISRQVMGFSDFPMPDTMPEIGAHHSQVWDYLQSYSQQFKLEKCITYNSTVDEVTPLPGGDWKVSATVNGEKIIKQFDAVISCTGHFWNPVRPAVKGEENFNGSIIHSIDFKKNEDFTDKNIVIVGCGASGGEIASELCTVSKSVHLSVRRGFAIVPKIYPDGRPWDHHLSRVSSYEPDFDQQSINSFKSLCKDNDEIGVKQPDWNQPKQTIGYTISSDLKNHMKKGNVISKPAISYVDGDSVFFEDGSKLDDIDAVILCTGYELKYPFLKKMISAKNNKVSPLYQHLFYTKNPTLAIVEIPFGSIPLPLAEMQARWVSAYLSGNVSLPTVQDMDKSFHKWESDLRKKNVTDHFAHKIDHCLYLDFISTQIGAYPSVWKHLDVCKEILLGPLSGTVYRFSSWGASKKIVKEQFKFSQDRLKCEKKA